MRALFVHPLASHPSSLAARSSQLAVALTVALLPLLFAFGCSTARYSSEPSRPAPGQLDNGRPQLAEGGPSLVLPARFAEGKGEPGATPSSSAVPPPAPGSSATPSGSASPPAPALSSAPDPTALRMAEQVEYELELSEGKIRVVSVKPVKLGEPVVTPRRLGRYAVELSIGHELIERLRFDFPATAADEPEVGTKHKLYAPLTLSARAIAHVKLHLPQSPRVRRAALVDRATNTVTELPWLLPDVAKAPPAPSSAAAVPSASVPAPAGR